MPEQLQTADPAVTMESIECSESVENTLSGVEDSSLDTKNPTDPAPISAVPAEEAADPEYVLINCEQVPIVRFSIDDIIHRSAARLRQRIFEEQGGFRSEQNGAVCPPISPSGE